MNNTIKNISQSGYTRGFVINLIVLALIYKVLGWEWFWVLAIADITRDLGMIIKKLYENDR